MSSSVNSKEKKEEAKVVTTAPLSDRKFEVLRKVNLGRGDVRDPGSEISRAELRKVDADAKLDAGSTEAELLGSGHILDSDAPIPPSKAEGTVAFNRLASIAQKIGVLRRSGNEYRLGERAANGLAAFRESVSLDDLEAAIVQRANG